MNEIELEPDNSYSKLSQDEREWELLHPDERQLMERLDKEIKTELRILKSFSKHFDEVFKEF